MVLFCVMPCIVGGLWLYDYMYPEAAAKARMAHEKARRADALIEFRSQLELCYKAANKPEKLEPTKKKDGSPGPSKVETLVQKYGRYEERQVALWAELYELYPIKECCQSSKCKNDASY